MEKTETPSSNQGNTTHDSIMFMNLLDELELAPQDHSISQLYPRFFSPQIHLGWLHGQLFMRQNPIFGLVLMEKLKECPELIPKEVIETTVRQLMLSPKKCPRQLAEYETSWRWFCYSLAVSWLNIVENIPLNECYKKVATLGYECLQIRASARTVKEHFYLETRDNVFLKISRLVMEGIPSMASNPRISEAASKFSQQFPNTYAAFLVSSLDY